MDAMMQDTTSNGSYISRDWQYGFSQTYNKNNKNNGYYTPVLEILAGADIHPVTVDLGGGSVDGKGHAQAGREHRRLLRAQDAGHLRDERHAGVAGRQRSRLQPR